MLWVMFVQGATWAPVPQPQTCNLTRLEQLRGVQPANIFLSTLLKANFYLQTYGQDFLCSSFRQSSVCGVVSMCRGLGPRSREKQAPSQ